MCGIFLLLNNHTKFSKTFVQEQFDKGKNRGPENSVLTHMNPGISFGFHRLAINGLDEKSNQPFYIKDTMLICNGEIYNYKKLYKLMGIEPETNSDCEIIVHLYKKYGIEQTLHMLDGVFAFVLYDYSCNQMFIARDPYGVRPMYVLNSDDHMFGVASELKQLSSFLTNPDDNNNVNKSTPSNNINQFAPGSYQKIILHKYYVKWVAHPITRYYSNATISSFNMSVHSEIFAGIQHHLKEAVFKRCVATDRPIACLLSGGLDSSLITALVNEYYSKHVGKQLETYSIGLENSEDLKYARIVANYLNTKHTEIILTEDEFFNLIPMVIRDIESYDTTTVRASIGNYAIGSYISKHSSAKVIFNGDGSDELCGGYLYMHHSPDAIEYDTESRRLLNDMYLFDILRSDKCISSHGLEPRTPFLDRTWVQYYLSIHPSIRFHPGNKQCEKYLLRRAFSSDRFLNNDGKALLPDEILWRRKEAFSDGVSCQGRSLFTILQEKIEANIAMDEYNFDKYVKSIYTHLVPKTKEQYYYRTIFDQYYENMSLILPYFWMPKYTNATDPSARTLAVYNENDKEKSK